MHSKAKTYSEVTVLQVVGKSYDSVSCRLKGLSMSDGCIVSHNVVPNNHAAAEQMNEFKRFDLIQVKAARVKKDLLILDDVDLFEVTDKAGNPFQIPRHILGQGVAELRQLRQENLDLWGVQFPVGRAVQFNCKTTSADPNATILAADRVLGEVGESSKSEPERMKRKLHACPYCVRSFTELEKMLQHLQTDHSDA